VAGFLEADAFLEQVRLTLSGQLLSKLCGCFLGIPWLLGSACVDITLFLEPMALWEDILSSQIQFGLTFGSFDWKFSGAVIISTGEGRGKGVRWEGGGERV
jgi:hypothetical protein